MPILKKNIFNLGYQDNSSVIDKNILNQLNFENFDTKFDIIFMDPPYKEKNLSKIIKDIFEAKIIKDNGIIIIHRHKKDKDEFMGRGIPSPTALYLHVMQWHDAYLPTVLSQMLGGNPRKLIGSIRQTAWKAVKEANQVSINDIILSTDP